MLNSLILNTTPNKCILPSGCDYATFMRGLLIMESRIAIKRGIQLIGYLVYEDGAIYSEKSNIFLKPYLDKDGYEIYTLWNPKQVDCKGHRLVAEAFIPNPENKRCVNHKDGDKRNNNVSNLEWVTDSENQKHAYANGLNNRNGMNNGKSKLNPEKVLEIRSSVSTVTELSKKFNVSKNCIKEARNNKSWTHV